MISSPILRSLVMLVATSVTCMMLAAPAHGKALPNLPVVGVSHLRTNVTAQTLARLPELSPVARALRSASIEPAGESDPCSSQMVFVLALSDGSTSTANTGEMRVTCVAYDQSTGLIVVDGAGLERAQLVDLNSIQNIYVARAPFVVSADGTRMEIRARDAACALQPSPSTYSPSTIYVGIDGGYLAMIGGTFVIAC